MSRDDLISDEKINAFIDAQLAPEERARMLVLMQKDTELRDRVNQLRGIKEMVSLVYNSPPQPLLTPQRNSRNRAKITFAAGVLLVLGFSLGWWLHLSVVTTPLQVAAEKALQYADSKQKVLFHVSTMDAPSVELALVEAERLLLKHRQLHSPLDVEIVVNSKGLDVLRQSSPFALKVRYLASTYDNVTFLACGQSRENARQREGRPIELLPEAVLVPTALDRIVRRIKTGWTYIKV
ncbi:MAG: hypothetical protein OEZ68_10065 [Gammaproteobacteria bacterium]|nr:hypothetical protein [Gammaproteobacteria bacterium]MDH5801134.1 hypothetical protein [Gammaproteobacteria bacterium]